MYETNPEEQVIYDEIPQDRLQPEPTEAPEVAQAAPAPEVESAQQQQKRYTEELQQRNWAEIRRIQEQKDREYESLRKEVEQLRQSGQKPKDELGIAKDAYAEVQHVERIVEARLREQQDRYDRQFAAQRQLEAERSLNAQYKDLHQVLSPENLKRLEFEEPEIAASIASNPDLYSAKVAAYKQIKKLGIVEDNYNSQRVQERLAQNSIRPKSPAALAPRQGSQALAAAPATSGFAESITEDMASRYRKEMEEAISRM